MGYSTFSFMDSPLLPQCIKAIYNHGQSNHPRFRAAELNAPHQLATKPQRLYEPHYNCYPYSNDKHHWLGQLTTPLLGYQADPILGSRHRHSHNTAQPTRRVRHWPGTAGSQARPSNAPHTTPGAGYRTCRHRSTTNAVGVYV